MAGEWDESLPIDHTKVGALPGECRKITEKVETVLIKEHEDLGNENIGCQHRLGSAVANEGTTTPTKTVDITAGSVSLANVARDRGRLWINDNFNPPVLERWAGTAWEVVGTIAAGASPNVAKLISTTAEDSDGGRESMIDYKGTQTGAELTTLVRVQASHEGSSDDEKGQLGILLNDGDDTNTPSKEAIRFKSTGKINVANSLCVLDEDDLVSDDAEVLATQQSIKAYIATLIGSSFHLIAVDGTPTKVYTLYLTGTLDADASTSVAHGRADVDKILHVSMVLYNDNVSQYYGSEAHKGASAGNDFLITFDGTNVIISAVGANFQGNKYRIKLDYIL